MDTHRRHPAPRWTRIVAALLLACLAALPGCKEKKPVANTTDPQWIEPRNPGARVAVVFIHGLFGDTLGTWTARPAPDEASFFSLLRAAPDVGDKVDLFAFGFTSDMFGTGSLNIREAANSLENKLESNGVWDYDNVVFVAHSMGGLVTLRYLITHPEHRRKVPLVALYASPMDGAQIANIAEHVASNPALAQMLDSDANEFLATLNEDWARIPANERPLVRCAYETAKTKGIMVVTRRSGTRYCVGNLLPVEDSNHIDIVKPDRPTHPSVEMLVTALKRDVFGTIANPRFAAPDFALNDAGEWVFTYRAESPINSADIRNTGQRPLALHIGTPSHDKLLVTPYPNPPDIAAGASQEVGMFLLALGEVRPEYTFKLRIGVDDERTVRVVLDDVAALARQESQATGIAAEAVGDFLQQNRDRLNALSEDAQRTEIADAARVALARHYTGLPEETQWLLTANALSRMPVPDLTSVALRNVERVAPTVAGTPAVAKFAASVSAQSGARVFEHQVPPPDVAPVPAPGGGGDGATAPDGGTPPVVLQDAARWNRLAENLQGVSSQQQNGLVLQGDVLRQQGRPEQAAVAYRNAGRIADTPAVRKRLREVQR